MNEEWKNEGVEYTVTNENLYGIVGALRLRPEDYVLAVGGSGDQAMAMLGKAKRVKAVDSSQAQIDFFKRRISSLKEFGLEGFLSTGCFGKFDGKVNGIQTEALKKHFLEERRKYFLERDRLQKAVDNLSGLEISDPANIFEVASTEPGVSRVYLSNALNWDFDLNDHEITSRLAKIASNLPEGGLIYVVNHFSLYAQWQEHGGRPSSAFGCRNENIHLPGGIPSAGFLPRSLVLDVGLTMGVIGSENGNWSPAVYRKVSD